MKLGRVVGTVVATRKDAEVGGLKLLLVAPCGPDGRASTEETVVAADAVGAGVDEVVLYAVGSSARQTVLTKDKPVDATIMAIVDMVEADRGRHYDKGRDP